MSIVLYACELPRLCNFYVEALGFSVTEEDGGYARLILEDFELVLLQAPESVLSLIHI